ncbi:helix-turn-helix transcriptional regulator [Novosphingobium sp.]|jgi:AraC family transcriptional regulator|uniref:helix-turn-helix transcriptional regulator n=1 Tax=Novosphingobium sp. TaxID=1874826 RepID=UPI002FE02D9A
MQHLQPTDFATTQTEFRSDLFSVQLNRFHLAEPMDDVLRTGEGYRLDLALHPRPGSPRGRYRDRWASHRFEPIGPLFLVRQGERVQARSEPGHGAAVVCHLAPSAVANWFDDEMEWTDRRLEACLDLRSPELKALLHRMASELREPGFAHGLLLEALAVQAVVELRRHCVAIENDRAQGGLAPWRLRLIEERLTERLDTPRLEELAQLCGVSVRQLTRGFRASRGCSIADHVADARVEHARRMIAEGQSIKAVAAQLGFVSPSSFTQSFRRATGVTPGQFRESLVRASV